MPGPRCFDCLRREIEPRRPRDPRLMEEATALASNPGWILAAIHAKRLATESFESLEPFHALDYHPPDPENVRSAGRRRMLGYFGEGIRMADGARLEAKILDIEPTLDRPWAKQCRADYLMWREEDKHFAVVEEKALTDPSNAFCGLIQALRYLSVVTTAHQFRRMKSLFKTNPESPRIHAYVVLMDFPKSRYGSIRPDRAYLAAHDDLCEQAQKLAAGLFHPPQESQFKCVDCGMEMVAGDDAMIESIKFLTFRSERYPEREHEVLFS